MLPTSKRSCWSLFTAYRDLGRLRARTGPLWIAVARLLISIGAGLYFLLTTPSITLLTFVIAVVLLLSIVGIDLVVIGVHRVRSLRPLVKIVDAPPDNILPRAIAPTPEGEEEIPIYTFPVSHHARTMSEIRKHLGLEIADVARELRVSPESVAGLERGSKVTSEREWGIVMGVIRHLAERKIVQIDTRKAS